MRERNLSYYIKEAKRLSADADKKADVRIALLATFTVRGLKDVISVKCREISLRSEVYEADYHQIHQEIMGQNSGLCRFDPHITFLLIHPGFVFGDHLVDLLQDRNKRDFYIHRKLDEYVRVVHRFLKNFSGFLVISNLKGFSYSPLGISDEKVAFSVKDLVSFFNSRLKEEFQENKRVFIYDLDGFFRRYGEYHITDEKFYYIADMFIGPEYLSLLGEDLMGYVKPLCSKNRKCLVLDLDNTLWGGVIGEDGFDHIKLDNKSPGNSFMDFQRHILELHKRGIILAVNSKNNYEDAVEVIRRHPFMVLREEHFACMKINWNDKVTNMKEIARELNIGMDSLVFVDDDPVNRALIKEAMPEVLAIDLPEDPSLFVRTLKQLNDFNVLQVTDEDFKKGEMYHQQRKREELKSRVVNIDDFLTSLGQKVDIQRADSFTVPRISQLTLKTNQFNLTSRRYSEDDIQKFSESPDHLVYTVKVSDKFGDSGYVGVFIVRKASKAEWVIDTFLLSCRVIGRKIEKVMLNAIFKMARTEGVKTVVGEYVPSKKNGQTSNFYPEHGFAALDHNRFIIQDPDCLEGLDDIVVTFS
jgi:FkbH-like protein